MKLLVIIVQDADAARMRDAFVKHGVPLTRLASSGGFLRRGNTTFLSGVPDHQLELVKQLVELNCKKREVPLPTPRGVDMADMDVSWLDEEAVKVEVGGATVFVLDVEEFVKL